MSLTLKVLGMTKYLLSMYRQGYVPLFICVQYTTHCLHRKYWTIPFHSNNDTMGDYFLIVPCLHADQKHESRGKNWAKINKKDVTFHLF